MILCGVAPLGARRAVSAPSMHTPPSTTTPRRQHCGAPRGVTFRFAAQLCNSDALCERELQPGNLNAGMSVGNAKGSGPTTSTHGVSFVRCTSVARPWIIWGAGEQRVGRSALLRAVGAVLWTRPWSSSEVRERVLRASVLPRRHCVLVRHMPGVRRHTGFRVPSDGCS